MSLLTPLSRVALAITWLVNGWRLSRIPGEASNGIRTKPVRRRDTSWPLRFYRGELVFVPRDGALGFRVPAGAIFALNIQGIARTLTAPSNRAWWPIAGALRQGATSEQLSNFVDRTAGPAAKPSTRHWRLQL